MIVDGKQKQNLQAAVELIKNGDVVGFPTETVYGLGGDAFSIKAVEKIYSVKKRPFSDPLILHIASHEQLSLIAEDITGTAKKLIEKFWPGPLTLIFRKKPIVPDLVTAGLNTVAVRMPRHLVALALIKNSGRVIAAPSANRFQSLSPTTALAVEKELGGQVPLILDGGDCQVGVESTVVFLDGVPRLLRPGGVSREELESQLGFALSEESVVPINKKLSPGLQDFHYAPQVPLKYFSPPELLSWMSKKRHRVMAADSVLICFSSDERKKFDKKGFKKILILSNCGNLAEAARNLFSTLRQCDEGEFKYIMALACPTDGLGAALNDRLKKAEHGF